MSQPNPTPETIGVAHVLYLFDNGRYGRVSEWTVKRVTITKVTAEGRRFAAQVVSGNFRTPVTFRWSEAKRVFVPVGQTYTGELRHGLDPDVIYARKLAVARLLHSEAAKTRGDKYGNPEDPDAYVARVSEAATQAGTRLLRIQEGL
jgi:hypothetical protein